MKRYVCLIAAFLVSLTAQASVTLTINVSALSGGTSPSAYIRVDLQNCISPTIVGTGTPVPASQKVYPVGGVAVVTLPDNVNQIACSGVQFSYYTFTLVYSGTETFIKNSMLPAGQFNLANLQNITTPPFNFGIITGPQGPAGPGGVTTLTGNGTPTATGAGCSAPYGTAYIDTSTNPNGYYICGGTGWQQVGGSGGGGIPAGTGLVGVNSGTGVLVTPGTVAQGGISGLGLPEFSVLNYGADRTGTNSSTTAANAAYAAARAAGGGVVVFPGGTYKARINISTCTSPTSQVIFYGYGATVIPDSSATDSTQVFADNSACSGGGFTDPRVKFIGFIFDGRGTAAYNWQINGANPESESNVFVNATTAAFSGFFVQYMRSTYDYFSTQGGAGTGFLTTGSTTHQSNEITMIGDRFNSNAVCADIRGGQSIRLVGPEFQNCSSRGLRLGSDTSGQAATSILVSNMYGELNNGPTIACDQCTNLTVNTAVIEGGGTTPWFTAGLAVQLDVENVQTPFQPTAIITDTSAFNDSITWKNNTQAPDLSGLANTGQRFLQIENNGSSPDVNSDTANTRTFLGTSLKAGNSTYPVTMAFSGTAPFIHGGTAANLVLGSDASHQNVFFTPTLTNFGTIPISGQTLTFSGVATLGGIVLTGSAAGCASFNSSGVLSSTGAACGTGGGSVASVTGGTASGITIAVANSTTTPVVTVSAVGAITPTSVASTGPVSSSGPGSAEFSLTHTSGTSPALPSGSFSLLSPLTNPTTAFGWRLPSSWAGGPVCVTAAATDSEGLNTGTITPCATPSGDTAITCSGTTAIPITTGTVEVTLTGNCTLTIASGGNVQNLYLVVIQSSTTAYTLTPPASLLGFMTTGSGTLVLATGKRASQEFRYLTTQTAWTPVTAGVINY